MDNEAGKYLEQVRWTKYETLINEFLTSCFLAQQRGFDIEKLNGKPHRSNDVFMRVTASEVVMIVV